MLRGDIVTLVENSLALGEFLGVAAGWFGGEQALQHFVVFLHDSLRLVLAAVVHDAHHVLSHLNLALVGRKVSVDAIVPPDPMSVKNLHAPRRHAQPLGHDEVLCLWKKQVAFVLYHSFLLLIKIFHHELVRRAKYRLILSVLQCLS